MSKYYTGEQPEFGDIVEWIEQDDYDLTNRVVHIYEDGTVNLNNGMGILGKVNPQYLMLVERQSKDLQLNLTVSEIQYLRGLIINDQIANQYQQEGRNALIDQKTTMWEFTNELLQKVNKLD